MFKCPQRVVQIIAVVALMHLKIVWAQFETKFTNAVDENIIISIKSLINDRHKVSNDKLIFSVHFQRGSLHLRYHYNDLVEELLSGDIRDCSQTVAFHQHLEFIGYSHYKIVLVDTAKSLSYVYKKLKEHGSGNLANTIILISSIRDPYHRDVTSTLKLLWAMSVLNVGIIVKDVNDEIVMVSYYPFGPGVCQKITPVIVNRFDTVRQRWTSQDFFPPKLNNFYGCKLTCATWPDMPYLEVQHNEKHEIVGFKGIEGELLKFMAVNLNFSIDLYLLNDEQVSQTFDENGFIFKEIFEKYADYALGGFQFRPDVSGNATFSQTSYYFLSSVYIVTNIFNIYSSYEKLAMPLDYDAWLMIVLIFTLGFIVIFVSGFLNERQRAFILGRGESTKFAYYHMFVVLMGGTKSTLPLRNFARYLLTVWLLTTLVLRSVYQSGMYAMLRDNKQRDPPQTIEAVVRQHYNITLTSINLRYLANVPVVPNVHILNMTELEALPHIVASDQRTAILLPYEYFGHFRKTNVLSRRLYLVRERIFTQPLSFFVRHNSYLVRVWNDQIANSQTFGFSQVWSRNLVEPVENIITNSKEEPTNETQTEIYNILSMKHLKGIFMILIWAHLCSIGIFVLEFTIHRTSRFKKNSLHTKLHNLLSPY